MLWRLNKESFEVISLEHEIGVGLEIVYPHRAALISSI